MLEGPYVDQSVYFHLLASRNRRRVYACFAADGFMHARSHPRMKITAEWRSKLRTIT
jgi:hypothetical protein